MMSEPLEELRNVRRQRSARCRTQRIRGRPAAVDGRGDLTRQPAQGAGAVVVRHRRWDGHRQRRAGRPGTTVDRRGSAYLLAVRADGGTDAVRAATSQRRRPRLEGHRDRPPSHDNPAERVFGDADVLIRRADYHVALAALNDARLPALQAAGAVLVGAALRQGCRVVRPVGRRTRSAPHDHGRPLRGEDRS